MESLQELLLARNGQVIERLCTHLQQLPTRKMCKDEGRPSSTTTCARKTMEEYWHGFHHGPFEDRTLTCCCIHLHGQVNQAHSRDSNPSWCQCGRCCLPLRQKRVQLAWSKQVNNDRLRSKIYICLFEKKSVFSLLAIGVKLQMNTANRPKADRLTESVSLRFLNTLCSRAFVNHQHSKWDELLPLFQFATIKLFN